MPRGRSPAGEVLFSRGSQEGDSTADDWDDTELLKEYDRAVRPLKALVAERMGLSNAEVEEASATESCGSSRSAAIENHAPKSHKRNNRKRHRKAKHKQQREWAVGDHCQAQFTTDGKWYEATILSIDSEQGICSVQYVGYGNKEELPLSVINQSMGAAVRREQARIANLEKDLDSAVNQSDDILERSSQASSSVSCSPRQPFLRRNKQTTTETFPGTSSSNFAHGLHMFTEPPTLGGVSGSGAPGFSAMPSHSAMHDMVAPPLPPHILTSLPADDSEALSAMLMSWYMSGFHTGYFQGLKRARNSGSSPQSNL